MSTLADTISAYNGENNAVYEAVLQAGTDAMAVATTLADAQAVIAANNATLWADGLPGAGGSFGIADDGVTPVALALPLTVTLQLTTGPVVASLCAALTPAFTALGADDVAAALNQFASQTEQMPGYLPNPWTE